MMFKILFIIVIFFSLLKFGPEPGSSGKKYAIGPARLSYSAIHSNVYSLSRPVKALTANSAEEHKITARIADCGYMPFFIVIIFVSLAFFFIMYFRRKKIQAELKILKSKYREIEERNKELEIINADLRIEKNNLLETEKKNQSIAKSKDLFFSIIASDLKKPFSGMLTSTYLLSNNFDKLQHKEIKKRIKQLDMTSRKLFTFLESILLWSKLQTNTIEVFPERIELRGLIENCAELFAATASEKNISIECLIEPEIAINSDLNLTFTIIRNLVSNALNFSFEDSQIKIWAVTLSDKVVLHIEDSGVGIEAEKVNRLFDISAQPNCSKSGASSVGFGLILAKGLIETIGGGISVRSEPGMGSVFSVTFPIFR